jgi:hypothetical protein
MRKTTEGVHDVNQEWEYTVETIGSIWRGPSSNELESLLNEAASEGWELVTAFNLAGGNRILVILRRALQTKGRKRRSTWP